LFVIKTHVLLKKKKELAYSDVEHESHKEEHSISRGNMILKLDKFDAQSEKDDVLSRWREIRADPWQIHERVGQIKAKSRIAILFREEEKWIRLILFF